MNVFLCEGEFTLSLLLRFYVATEKAREEIEIRIDSPGGLGTALTGMLNEISWRNLHTRAIVTGKACSAAFVLLQACRVRMALPRATFMFHCPRVDTQEVGFLSPEPYAFYPDDPEYQKFLRELAARSGQKYEDLELWGCGERVFTAPEALALGFIDEIIDGVPE